MTEETEALPHAPPASETITSSQSEKITSSHSYSERTAERTGELVEKIHEVLGDNHRAVGLTVTDDRDGTEIPGFLNPRGSFDPIQPALFDIYRANPLYRQGTATLTSLGSFIALVERFKHEDTVIYADDSMTTANLLAILDYHPAGSDNTAARARRHKARYTFPLSDEWKAWMAQNGKWMEQGEFAEFLEERITEVVAGADPKSEEAKRFLSALGGKIASPTDLVKLSRELEVHENAKVRNAQTLTSGEKQIQFETTHTDGSGAPISFPNVFVIGIPIFQRSTVIDQLIVRLRYRLNAGRIMFGYEVWRADLSFAHAVEDALDTVKAETGLSIFLGTPEA